MELLQIIGGYVVIKNIYKVSSRFLPYLYDRETVIKKQNNFDKWALIAGSTDGIGLEFSKQLIEKNYNLILVSRNSAKLLKTKQYLETLNSQCQITTYEQDFSSNLNPLQISQPLHLIINSVGLLNLNKIQSQLPDLPLINTNILSQLLLTELLLKQTEQNMINLGSIMGSHPMPFLSQYAATKAFGRVFCDSVVKESKITNGKIRMIHLMPFYVETKMTNYTKFIFSVQTEQFVKQAIRCFNYGATEAQGHWKHEIADILLGFRFYRQNQEAYLLNITDRFDRIKKLKKK